MWQRSTKLVEKSQAAIISAIEIYNKPDFKYREETFALLALNAWELLLKAKLLAENHNDVRAIYQREKRTKKDGTPSKKEFLKKNRCGLYQTVSLGRAIVLLDRNPSTRLDSALKANLDALSEIRDNAAHYMNAGPQLAKQVLEIGTATVRNYVSLTKSWFKRDLSRYSLFLMPLGFLGVQRPATAVSLGHDENSLIEYLIALSRMGRTATDSDFHVALTVNLSLQRSNPDAAAKVFITSDPNAPNVILTEEDIRKSYPWDYNELTKRLARRYIDFKANRKYHEIRKSLLKDLPLVKTRVLDPGNPKSAKKDFYNPNIFKIFDQHYTKR